jgi:hypothetical protein
VSDTPWTPRPWNAVKSSAGDWWVEGPSWVFSSNNDAGLESEADARLIAAAPEMAELLERCVEEGLTPPESHAARALLRRIRGEEPTS